MGGELEGRAASGPARRRWLVGLLVGVVVASGALAAAVFEDTHRRDDAEVERAGEQVDPGAPRGQWRHEYPATYAGPVWIVVDASDEAERHVTITWGPWRRSLVHRAEEPVAYRFTKEAAPDGRSPVTVSVEVDPPAVVSFDHGASPAAGAVDINEGWVFEE